MTPPRPDQPHNVAALVMSGLILVALAVAISSTWIDDGDGTCRALYDPNLARGGCARKLMPAALTAAVLVGAAILVWDSARRAGRKPSRGAALIVAVGLIALCAQFGSRVVVDRWDRADQRPGAAPVPAPTLPSDPAPKAPPVPAPSVAVPIR